MVVKSIRQEGSDVSQRKGIEPGQCVDFWSRKSLCLDD